MVDEKKESRIQTDLKNSGMSYAQLISEALENSSNGILVLPDICESINARHPYYSMKTLQKCIKHSALTIHKSFSFFVKKGVCYWKLSKNPSKALRNNKISKPKIDKEPLTNILDSIPDADFPNSEADSLETFSVLNEEAKENTIFHLG